MKKTLLILLVLAFAVPAGAEVFVYNWKEKMVEHEQDGGDWYTWKGNYKGYLVIDIQGDVAYATFIEMWTEKWGGETHKYMDYWEDKFEIITVEAGKKIICVMSSGDDEYRILLTGEIKKGILLKLSGTLIWDETYGPYDRNLGTAQESVSLNKKWTAIVTDEGFDDEQTRIWIGDELEKKGYEWD